MQFIPRRAGGGASFAPCISDMKRSWLSSGGEVTVTPVTLRPRSVSAVQFRTSMWTRWSNSAPSCAQRAVTAKSDKTCIDMNDGEIVYVGGVVPRGAHDHLLKDAVRFRTEGRQAALNGPLRSRQMGRLA